VFFSGGEKAVTKKLDYRFIDENVKLYNAVDGLLPNKYDVKIDTIVRDVNEFSTEFAYVDVIEMHILRNNFVNANLSEQHVIDCNYENNIFDFARNGICSEKSYPFLGRESKCKSKCNVVDLSVVKSYERITDENSLMDALVNHGPVVSSIDASKLEGFGKEIFKDCEDKNNHAIIITGYGEENGEKYWTIKNNWGYSFGENGYFKLMRNENSCGLYNNAFLPVF